MKKIVIVAKSLGASGKPLYWEPIFSGVAKSGFDVVVMTEADIEFMPTSGVKSKAFNGSFLALLRGLISEANNGKGVVFVVEFSVYSFLALLLSRMLGCHSVLMVENHPKYLEGYGLKRRGGHDLWRKLLCKISTRVLVNNDEGRSYVVDELGVCGNKVIKQPYLTSQFHSSPPASSPDRKLRIATWGQLIKRKGFVEFLDEIASFSSDLKKSICIHVFGGGELRETLDKRIVSLGLQSVVEMMGVVDYRSFSETLSRYDLFVLPTLADYRSLASFEAISIGRPLVISKYDGACNEVVTNGVNGFIYDPCISGQLKEIVEKFTEGKVDVGGFCVQSVLIAKKFSVEKAVEGFLNTYGLVGAYAGK